MKINGPPQLEGICVPLTEIDYKLVANIDSLSHLLTVDECWKRKIACTCGNDLWYVYHADANSVGWVSGRFAGSIRVRVICSRCDNSYLLFDDGLHGYNAVICDERSELPQNYESNNERLLIKYACSCGTKRFSLYCAAVYDCFSAEEADTLKQEQLDHSFGYFVAVSYCTGCSKPHALIECETA